MNDDQLFQLGCPDCILTLARGHGLTVPQKSSFLGNPMEQATVKSYTLKLMSKLKEFTLIKDSLEQVQYEITTLLLDQGSMDLIHTPNLDQKQKQLDDLMTYFSKVGENIETLVTQLQKDIDTSSSLKIERKYHKEVCESLSTLINILNKLPENEKLIENMKIYNFKSDSKKVNPLSKSVQLLVECKLDVQRLQNHFTCRSTDSKN